MYFIRSVLEPQLDFKSDPLHQLLSKLSLAPFFLKSKLEKMVGSQGEDEDEKSITIEFHACNPL